MKVTKTELVSKATKRLQRMTKEELQHFIESFNPCLHKHTEKCGMDVICKDCGDWV